MKKKMTMPKILLKFLLLPVLCGGLMTGFGQRPGSGQLSDQQIMVLWQQAQMSGMSEADLMKMLSKQGFNASDINGLRQRLTQLKSVSSISTSTVKPGSGTVSSLPERDTNW